MKTKNKILFVLLYIIYSTVYICRLNLSIASPILTSDGIITASQLGVISGVFFVLYAIGRFFNGYLGDRIQPRILMAIALLIISCASVLFGIIPFFAGMIIFWGINGYAQSMIWGPLLNVVANNYDKQTRNNVIAILASSVSFGSVAGILIAQFAVSYFAVKFAFIIPGIIALIAGLISFFFIPSINQSSGGKMKAGSVKISEIGIVILPAFLHGIIKDNINTWAPLLFVAYYSIEIKQLSWFVFVIPLLGFVGRLIYPPIFKLCKNNENLVSTIGFITTSICVLVLIFVTTSPIITAIALSLISCAIQVINTSMLSIIPMKFSDKNATSTVSGIMDLATYSGTGIGSVVFGFMIDNLGYTSMFSAWLLATLVSIVVLAILIRKNKKTT